MSTKRYLRIALAAGLLGGAGTGAGEPDEAGWLSPPDLYKLAEESDRSYTIRTTDELEDVTREEFAERLWPSKGADLEHPWIEKKDDGGSTLGEYDLDAGCVALLDEAAPLFDAKRYDEALPLYVKAAEAHPTCYPAVSRIGDCHYYRGEVEAALGRYERAVELNPFDFRGHFFKANTLNRLGRRDEALDAYVSALTLRPHRESIVYALRLAADGLGIRFSDEPFSPRAFAREEEDGIGIYIDPGRAHWLPYGLCKGVWIGEPEFREEQTGNSEHNWTLREERGCIMTMVESYFALRESGTVEADPEMERLLRILEDDLLDGFILYEIAYRVSPHIMLLVPTEMFDEVREYVRRHVIPKVGTADPVR